MEGDLKIIPNDNSERNIVIQASNLKKWFSLRSDFFSYLSRGEGEQVRAVDSVDFVIWEEEIYGLAGESGCGKTTLGKLLIRLLEPTDGKINFLGTDITHLSRKKMKKLRKDIQIIFQDPFSSLPVRLTVKEILYEPLKIHNVVLTQGERLKMVHEVLEATDLLPIKNFIDKHPNELSGGQRQRVCIARAIILKPHFIIADEPVSMLDVSVRAGILELIKNLRKEFGFTTLLITHDLSVAQYMCDRIGIMYVGKMVEEGDGKQILRNPYHPYTMLLKAVLPTLDPKIRHHLHDMPVVEAEIASPINPPLGCRFHPRCIFAKEICKEKEPLLKKFKDRMVACHGVGEWVFP